MSIEITNIDDMTTESITDAYPQETHNTDMVRLYKDYDSRCVFWYWIYLVIDTLSIFAILMMIHGGYQFQDSDIQLYLFFYEYIHNNACIFSQDTHAQQQIQSVTRVNVNAAVVIQLCVLMVVGAVYNYAHFKNTTNRLREFIPSVQNPVRFFMDIGLRIIYEILILLLCGCNDFFILLIWIRLSIQVSENCFYKDSQYCYRLFSNQTPDSQRLSSDRPLETNRSSLSKLGQRYMMKMAILNETLSLVCLLTYLGFSQSKQRSSQIIIIFILYMVYRATDIVMRVRFTNELYFIHHRNLFGLLLFWTFFGCMFDRQ